MDQEIDGRRYRGEDQKPILHGRNSRKVISSSHYAPGARALNPECRKNRATGKPAGIAITKNRGFSGSGFRAAAAAPLWFFAAPEPSSKRGGPKAAPPGDRPRWSRCQFGTAS